MTRISACLVLLLTLSGTILSQSRASATQVLMLEVRSVALLEVTGDPQPLTINSADAGNSVLTAEEASTSYKLTSSQPNVKLTVSIDEPMPAGTRLLVALQGGIGLSAGTVDISDALASVDAVTGISRGSVQNQRIDYRFEADASVGVIPPQTRTITLTLTD